MHFCIQSFTIPKVVTRKSRDQNMVESIRGKQEGGATEFVTAEEAATSGEEKKEGGANRRIRRREIKGNSQRNRKVKQVV